MFWRVSVAKEGEIPSPLAMSCCCSGVPCHYLSTTNVLLFLLTRCFPSTSILCFFSEMPLELFSSWFPCLLSCCFPFYSLVVPLVSGMEDISVSSFPCPLTAFLSYSSSYACASVDEDPSRPVWYTSFALAVHLHPQPVPASCLSYAFYLLIFIPHTFPFIPI